ncbi:MAG: response regulator, partial [Acidobacteriia bacterium]|nr:response regulator [Terriglobia bacterium]
VGILGNASLALEEVQPDSAARMALEGVLAASDRAAGLTRQMLAYSGKGQFVLERLELSPQIRETLPLIQSSIPRMVVLRLELEDQLPAIEADRSQIQQVVMNLIINAAEAIPEGRPGSVTITTRLQSIERAFTQEAGSDDLKPGAYVLFQVSDTGSGMDEVTKTKIFDPFFTTKFTGRGVGLAAVLGIVKGHGGGITVSSLPGRGTVFSVLFPALEAKPCAERQPTVEIPAHEGAGTILVIDDEEIVRHLAKRTLERYGYEVLLAEEGRQGVEAFRRKWNDIKCVVLDMTMPVMSGEETLALMREVRPDVPVIVSSGFNEVEAVRRFEGKALTGFLQKPYPAATLAQKVNSAVESYSGKSPSWRSASTPPSTSPS